MLRLILASSSPRRRELLGSLGVAFEVIKPEIDETQHPGEPPLDYVRRLSREKAEAIAAGLTDEAAVLAADTVVVLAADTIGVTEMGEVLGKPRDAEDARRILTLLRNRPHLVCTSFTILVYEAGAISGMTQPVKTLVYMRDYTDDEIEAYIATGDPFDKAGSYAIQHEQFHPVDHIDGSYTNVVGFPVEEIRNALIEIGVL
jgi:septum formation protein